MATLIDKTKSALGLGATPSTITLAGHELTKSTGYGLMGLTWRKTPPSQPQSFTAMREALAQGANFWNGGEIYGEPTRNSLHLLNEYFTRYPEDASKVVLSIKGAGKDGTVHTVGGDAENTRRSIQTCIDTLGGTKKLDLWEAARVDQGVPIEVTMRAAKEFIDRGELGGISLSECSARTIRRAAKVVKVSAVEVEVSLWSTEIFDNGVADACAELGIPIVAYSPLGRGFLTGEIKKFDDIPEGDMRRQYPRFQPAVFEQNLALVRELENLAQRKGCKPGQIGIAWIKAKSGKAGNPVMVPIPGATTPERIRENMVDVELSEADVKEIDALLASTKIAGARYPDFLSKMNFADTPEEK